MEIEARDYGFTIWDLRFGIWEIREMMEWKEKNSEF
jgi:hypothetical protein